MTDPKKSKGGELPPPLKWAGGKRWLVPRLREIYEEHRGCRLVEPFTGGLAVSLGLRPKRAILSDINPLAINFYRWLQSGLVIEFEMHNERRAYYEQRKRFNQLIANGETDSSEAAGLFYYLNRTGYNGLCRFNNSGFFNVPFGSYTRINYVRDFHLYRRELRGWTFRCQDFQRLRLQPRDFVYADPPYDVPFRKYAKLDFTWEDQKRLAHWLARHRGPAVASNQATPRILELYEGLGFTIKTLSAPRRIACTGDRKPALEMLALRNI